MSATLSTAGLDRFNARLEAEMMGAIPHALTFLKQLCIQIIVRLGAIDTLSLLLSVYISAFRYSEYEEAQNQAAEAYANNPTKYPEIRKAMGTHYEELPELKPTGPHEGWLGVGAAHGIPNERGFTSFYGNPVPPRPFVQDTAHEGMPIVLSIMQKALRDALRG